MLRTTSGKALAVGPKLATGGQGEIFRVDAPPGRVFKRYAQRTLAADPTLPRRLAAMAAAPPRIDDPDHPVLAWPTDVVEDDGRFAGFLMPMVDLTDTVELHQVANPTDRNTAEGPTAWLRGFNWRYSLRTAANLAAATQVLHNAGTVIGDFNERNVRVSRKATVTLLDCDSMQVRDPATGERFFCPVGRPEFTPPELLRADWKVTVRHPSSDLYALAIHLYQLLLEGEHPFRGMWRGHGEKPSVPELASQGIWTHREGGPLSPRPTAIGIDILPAELIELFRRAFEDGAIDPSTRPTAADWQAALSIVDKKIVQCPAVPEHMYPDFHDRCPWCRRTGVAYQVPLPPLPLPAGPRELPPALPVPVTRAGAGPSQPAPPTHVNAPVGLPPGFLAGASAAAGVAGVRPAPWVPTLLDGRLLPATLITLLYAGLGAFFHVKAEGVPTDGAPRFALTYLEWSWRLLPLVIAVYVLLIVVHGQRSRLATRSRSGIRRHAIAASFAGLVLCVVAITNWMLFFVQGWLVQQDVLQGWFALLVVFWLGYLFVVINAVQPLLYYLGKLVRSIFGKVTA